MRFDGDIIITDPCYIIRKDNRKDYTTAPQWWDFVSKTTHEVVIGSDGKAFKKYNMPKPEDYSDCRAKTIEDYEDKETAEWYMRLQQIGQKMPTFSPTLQAEWDAYHAAQEQWNKDNIDDWEKCCYGDNMKVLGLHTYLSDSTIYGDWSCGTFNSDTKKKIGEFCADSGMVAVFLLDEVLHYNPEFDYHTERPWTTTLIRDFHGTVELHCENAKVTVIGRGNVNFIGTQTGF